MATTYEESAQRICTGCAVLLSEDVIGSFCSKDCMYEFELSEAHAAHVYRLLDSGFYGAWDE